MNVKESKKLRKKSETQRQGLILEGDSSVPHCASCTACNVANEREHGIVLFCLDEVCKLSPLNKKKFKYGYRKEKRYG